MKGFIADKITNLTAARYFAAKGADWLFFDQQAGPELSLQQMLAIKEWVEGPKMGLYVALGAESLDKNLLDHLQPEGLLLGHFASLHDLPSGLTLFKEWRPESGINPSLMTSWIENAGQADHHVLRLDDWNLNRIHSIIGTLEALAEKHSLILGTQLSQDDWHQLLDTGLPVGYCFSSPTEEQVGLVAFDVLDNRIDSMEEML